MKKTTYDNFSVVTYPRHLGDLGSCSVPDHFMSSSDDDRRTQYRERAHEVAAQIKRHVDNVGVVSVEFDTEATCEHCGAIWTEGDSKYNGGCCDKDVAEQDASEVAGAA
mgnify:CR=1 FL=1